MITYLDTSTVIKLLVDEPGTSAAAALWDAADVLVTARISHVEARAALASAQRQRRITAAVCRRAVADLDLLWPQMAVVELDEALMRAAGDVAAARSLRGYHAVQLASAQLVGADVFSSADHRLCDAAAAAGFLVANPVAAAGS
ncbi:MAG: hypothetical protein RL238_3755 [Actinomycetota bacterium]